MAWSSSEAYTGDYYLPAGKSVRFCALWETAVRTRILCRMRSVLLRVLLRVSFLVCLFLCTYVVQCLWYMFITSVKLHTRRWSSKAVFLSVTVMSPYGVSTTCWLRCRLGFSLLRSAIRSLRGSRSSRGHAVKTPTMADLVIHESAIIC